MGRFNGKVRWKGPMDGSMERFDERFNGMVQWNGSMSRSMEGTMKGSMEGSMERFNEMVRCGRFDVEGSSERSREG